MKSLRTTLRTLLALTASAACAASVLGCSRTAGVEIVNVDTSKLPTGAILVDVEVAGYEQGGGAVGAYCVSVHWLPAGYVADLTDPQPGYLGELEYQESCPPVSEELRDGDRRTFRFVTAKTDLPSGINLRAQSRVGRLYDHQDVTSP